MSEANNEYESIESLLLKLSVEDHEKVTKVLYGEKTT